ncbi:hypothetical protein [Comamonas testosteroni]|uniref:hypothetical protein n=1 Tax=Comamonas testosteroni TaxID=285 RepID=UPI002DB59E2C|nr:hypothetical protein [Comamonas testosteroni]MEB5967369.1 hypothetical protein [Comamonas testosteroni]
MTIVHRTVSVHLNYFSCLEDDLVQVSRWIEFSSDNELVYSIELARLLMTASAEVDVVAKALCTEIDESQNASSINKYQSVLLKAIPTLPHAKVEMPRFGMQFQPWSNWASPGVPPDWWQGNNKVKHHRAEHFRSANLKNVLNAVAALLVLLLLFHSKDGPYFPQRPRLFVPRTFVLDEGHAFRLIIPDGTHLPWDK